MKSTEKFLDMIINLEAVEFLGLARVLGIILLEETNKDAEDLKDRYTPRAFMDVLEDMVKKFDSLSRPKKREILKLLKAATKKEASADAGNSKDS